MTQYIKAPFNFVKVSEKVFFPNWANQISHDIPFSDGESGEIELTITTHSPIFVRNGHTKAEAEAKSDDYKSFSKIEGKGYFIPATSLKGSVRNVLEIMSFGKMDSINNNRFALRDLDNKEDYMSKMKKIHCGWLTKNDDLITISDRGEPYYISHKELDNSFKTNFVSFFSNENNLKESDNRLASFKYNLFRDKNLLVNIEEIKKENGKIRVKINDKAILQGKIVFTGQFGVRKKEYDAKKRKKVWSGKFYEFIFPNEEKRIFPPFNEDDELWNDFKFIYKDSDDWDFWDVKLKNGESIPVFFKPKNDKEIENFGLSYLYKLPYKKGVKDCLPPGEQNNSGFDLADCIFGTVDDLSLKGRVQFGHAELEEGDVAEKVYNPLMGSPKASYFPIYLQQSGENGLVNNEVYKTYASNNAIIKGWKRYPIHKSNTEEFEVDEKQQKNTSPFIPIKKDAVFSTKIRYHNLKPVELGALLYAITFNDESAFHSIGFAKAYGFGKVKIQITNLDKYIKYLTSFETMMNGYISDWRNSKQMMELLLMAKDHDKLNDDHLSYMNQSDFAAAKKKDNPPTFLEFYSDYIRNIGNECNEINSQQIIEETTTKLKLVKLSDILNKK